MRTRRNILKLTNNHFFLFVFGEGIDLTYKKNYRHLMWHS